MTMTGPSGTWSVRYWGSNSQRRGIATTSHAHRVLCTHCAIILSCIFMVNNMVGSKNIVGPGSPHCHPGAKDSKATAGEDTHPPQASTAIWAMSQIGDFQSVLLWLASCQRHANFEVDPGLDSKDLELPDITTTQCSSAVSQLGPMSRQIRGMVSGRFLLWMV